MGKNRPRFWWVVKGKKDDFRDATEKSGMQVGAETGCDNKKGNRCEEIWALGS